MGQRKILVVEDEPDLAELLVQIFQAEGYRVGQACEGRAALRMLDLASVDLVVTDVAMPGMDGISLLKAIRADKCLSGTPVLVLSALPEADVRRKCAAVDKFIQKPFGVKDLLAHVEELLA